MSTEIEKSNLLPGGIGTMSVNGIAREISAINKRTDGSTTITIGAVKTDEIITEDVEAEIISPKTKLLRNS